MIEVLIVMFLFSIVLTSFYSVLFSGTRGSNVTRDVADITEEARLGLNRLIRDTREAGNIINVSPTSYTVFVDFNGNTVLGEVPPAVTDTEVITFSYDPATLTIKMNGEILIDGVTPISGVDMFQYQSNLLQYDWDNNGVTTLAELQAASSQSPPVTLAANKLIYISSVLFRFRITTGSSTSTVHSQAEMRNHDST